MVLNSLTLGNIRNIIDCGAHGARGPSSHVETSDPQSVMDITLICPLCVDQVPHQCHRVVIYTCHQEMERVS